jgi:hypothetical protein
MQFSNGVLLFIEKVGKFGASFSLPFSLMHCKPIMGLENGTKDCFLTICHAFFIKPSIVGLRHV